MTKLMKVVGAVALGLAFAVAHAQTYPLKPVRMVVPFPPGGSNDIVARLIAQKVGEAFNQQFIIDNRGGAGGAIGAQTVARAGPDGYTIMLTNPGPAIHNVLLRKDPLYAISDFAPIVYIGSSASIVAATPKFPAANLKELVAFAKAHPGKVSDGPPPASTATRISHSKSSGQRRVSTSCTCRTRAPARHSPTPLQAKWTRWSRRSSLPNRSSTRGG